MKAGEIIRNLNNPGETLSQRTVRSGFWVFLLRIAQQLFNLGRLVILARILAPHDFGLMGIALLTMATIDTFSQTGFQTALIQKKEDIKSYLDAAWTVLILRGLILFTILYLIAPYVAIFFNTPEARPIIQVIGFAVLFQAFTNIGVIYFQKELEFNKQFIYQFAGTLADFVVAVSAVLILRNVWALVFGLLAGNFARFVVSYLMHPYKPHLSSDLWKAKELFGFGKWILGSSILIFLITQGDDIFVGKLLGTTALGLYQLAYRISNMPTTEITHVISQVTFPAYSKLQDNIEKLREAYLRTVKVLAFVAIPTAGIILAIAYPFTQVVLGDKWLPMVAVMQLLTLQGAMRALGASTGPLFQAIGKPEIGTKLQFLQLMMMAFLIYPFIIHWGIFGAGLTIVSTGIILNFFVYREVLKIIQCSVWDFLKVIYPPVIITGIMIGVVYLANNIFLSNNLIGLALMVIMGMFVYLALSSYIDKKWNYGIFSLIKGSIKEVIR